MNDYPIPPDYTWNIRISSYDVDKNRNLKLSALLRLQQQVGELQFEEGGLGFEQIVKHQMIFVVTRLNCCIKRMPLLNEHVKMVTWHRSAKGSQFYRCYQILDSMDNVIVESVSAFALVDTQTHRLLRPSAFDKFGVNAQSHRKNNCPDPQRLSVPSSLINTGQREVRWSDIDYNGHLNNTVYADIVCDAMPNVKVKQITMLSMSFLNEALEGESIKLETAIENAENSNKAWIVGKHERGKCFEACLLFKSL